MNPQEQPQTGSQPIEVVEPIRTMQPTVAPPQKPGTGQGAVALFKRWQLWAGVAAFLLVLNSVGVTYLLLANKPTTVTIGTSTGKSGGGDTASGVLEIDMKSKSVGVGTTKAPQGLQVESALNSDKRGTANVRVGLLNGAPELIFEDKDGKQWQMGVTAGQLQYGEVGQPPVLASSTQNGQTTTTLGNAANSQLIVQGTNIAAPNNLAVDGSTLFVDTTRHQVAIGTQNTQGYKLYVAGTIRTSGTLTADAQVLVAKGSASAPGYAFQGASSSGLFAGNNSVSLSANGSEVLRVQQGLVSVLGGNLQTDGYIQAGTGASNPAWQVKRLSGTVSGPDMNVAHGLSSNRILLVNAYYLDSTGVAWPIFDSFDSGSIHLANGAAGRPYVVTITYASTGASW